MYDFEQFINFRHRIGGKLNRRKIKKKKMRREFGMYCIPYMYSYGYPLQTNNYNRQQNNFWINPYQAGIHPMTMYTRRETVQQGDFGGNPYVVNINEAAKANDAFRRAIWTGSHLQVTLMSIPVGGDIGLEIHPDTDQFLRIEAGEGLVRMGKRQDELTFERRVFDEDAIMVPAGTWHNVINTGSTPLKLYSIYAPPHHPFGTVHNTQAEALAAEEETPLLDSN